MEMTILERTDAIVHVAFNGRLDTNAAEELDDRFRAMIAERGQPTVVDLSGVDFLASRGISLLLGGSKFLRKAGHRLVLLSPQPLVDASLRTAKLERVMPIVYELDDAIRLVRDGDEGQSTTAASGSAGPGSPVASEDPATAVEPGSIRFAIKNELSELKGVIEELSQFLAAHHVPKRAAYAASLAVDELVVNVMRYAYMDDDAHIIDLDVSITGDQVVLEIVDDGRRFDPRTGPALDLHAEDRQEGGLGLLLVLEMVDVLKYERIEDRNRVEIRIHLGGDVADKSTTAAGSGEGSTR